MKKDATTYVGRFGLSKIMPNRDGTIGCELIGIEDENLKLTLGHVLPSIKNLDFVDAWQEGQQMLLEIVMKDGQKHQSWVQGYPLT